jgi:hypothetical protein
MLENDFHNWLLNKKGYVPRTVNSRKTNCLRVEQFEGDLDKHFERDQCRALLGKHVYTVEDKKHNHPPKHSIPINGDIRTGTATFKQAVGLYVEFKIDMENGVVVPGPGTLNGHKNSNSGLGKGETLQKFPAIKLENKISRFNNDLAKILASLAYHIAPEIVQYIIEQNKNDCEYFKKLFGEKIEPDNYFFPGSSCVFPGIRRYISDHNDATGKYNEKYKAIVDDNVFPRYIWCYLLGGKGYSSPMYKKTGLNEFELAHIFAHKKTEINDEKEFFKTVDKDLRPYGEFTSAANIVLLPKGTVRPTDNSTILKSIFYKRYIDLYGEETLNGRNGFIEARVPDWYSAIEWNPPLLPADWKKKIDALLGYRKNRITLLLGDKQE